MRRSILAGLVAGLLIAGFAAPASAAGPKPEPPPDSVQEFAAGDVCPFAVRLEGWSNEKVRTSVDRQGRATTVITGSARTRVTNLESSPRRSLVVHTGGRVVLFEPDDGTLRISATGRTLFFFFEGDQTPAGTGAGLFLVSGQVEETLDLETDVITRFAHRGTYRDLCAALG